jgi:hypothetical protein
MRIADSIKRAGTSIFRCWLSFFAVAIVLLSLLEPSAANASGGADTPCPASKITAGSSQCHLLTPEYTGAAVSENYQVPSWALTPSLGVRALGKLVLHLNSSGSHPDAQIAHLPTVSAGLTQNFYLAAATLGYHVIGLSYMSNTALKTLCSGYPPDCYFASRKTLILGVHQPHEAMPLREIVLSAGIAQRLVLILKKLEQDHANEGWGSYLVAGANGVPPEQKIVWSNIVASGHSQGGGHAAAIGKLFSVARVIQLSGTCDETNGKPAPWLFAANGTWATDPTKLLWGLDAKTHFENGQPVSGDKSCFTHAASWEAEGMNPAQANDNDATCGMTGNQHDASIGCADNYATWQNMLQ